MTKPFSQKRLRKTGVPYGWYVPTEQEAKALNREARRRERERK
jgi:hypothetical protein